jgi:hypothetical protein
MATISLGVLGVIGAQLAVTGIFGMAAYLVRAAARARNSNRARRAAQGSFAGSDNSFLLSQYPTCPAHALIKQWQEQLRAT